MKVRSLPCSLLALVVVVSLMYGCSSTPAGEDKAWLTPAIGNMYIYSNTDDGDVRSTDTIMIVAIYDSLDGRRNVKMCVQMLKRRRDTAYIGTTVAGDMSLGSARTHPVQWLDFPTVTKVNTITPWDTVYDNGSSSRRDSILYVGTETISTADGDLPSEIVKYHSWRLSKDKNGNVIPMTTTYVHTTYWISKDIDFPTQIETDAFYGDATEYNNIVLQRIVRK